MRFLLHKYSQILDHGFTPRYKVQCRAARQPQPLRAGTSVAPCYLRHAAPHPRAAASSAAPAPLPPPATRDLWRTSPRREPDAFHCWRTPPPPQAAHLWRTAPPASWLGLGLELGLGLGVRVRVRVGSGSGLGLALTCASCHRCGRATRRGAPRLKGVDEWERRPSPSATSAVYRSIHLPAYLSLSVPSGAPI